MVEALPPTTVHRGKCGGNRLQKQKSAIPQKSYRIKRYSFAKIKHQLPLIHFFLFGLGNRRLRTPCGVSSLTVHIGNSQQVMKYCAFFITTLSSSTGRNLSWRNVGKPLSAVPTSRRCPARGATSHNPPCSHRPETARDGAKPGQLGSISKSRSG